MTVEVSTTMMRVERIGGAHQLLVRDRLGNTVALFVEQPGGAIMLYNASEPNFNDVLTSLGVRAPQVRTVAARELART